MRIKKILILLFSAGSGQYYDQENEVTEDFYDYDGTFEPVESIKRKRG